MPLILLPLVTTAVAVLALTVMIRTGGWLTSSAHPPLVRSGVLLLFAVVVGPLRRSNGPI